MTMALKLVQPENALTLISVTLSGMVMAVKAVQPMKVLLSMVVLELGSVMLFRLLQRAKAPCQISVTLSAMITLYRLVQFSKAQPLMADAGFGGGGDFGNFPIAGNMSGGGNGLRFFFTAGAGAFL